MIFIMGDLENVSKKTFDEAIKHLKKTEKYHQIYHDAVIVNARQLKDYVPDITDKERTDLLIHVLSCCDILYMLKGWESDAECRLVHEYAWANSYRIIYSKLF